jgi:hypothetical protein
LVLYDEKKKIFALYLYGYGEWKQPFLFKISHFCFIENQ